MKFLGIMAAILAAFYLLCAPGYARGKNGNNIKSNFVSGFTKQSAAKPGKKAKAKSRRKSKAKPVAARGAGKTACATAARKHGVPLKIAMATCHVESTFRCDRRGRAGEYGLLQIKPATARGIGYKGPLSKLSNCDVGAYWGMKHLALAIKKGGLWKHNQGLYAKKPSKYALKYASKVQRIARLY